VGKKDTLNQALLSGNEALFVRCHVMPSRALDVVFKGEGVEENEKAFLDGRKMGPS